MKRNHRQRLAIAGVIAGLVLVAIGLYMKETLPPELPMSAPGWFESVSERNDREMNAHILIFGGGFLAFATINIVLRLAKKLKV